MLVSKFPYISFDKCGHANKLDPKNDSFETIKYFKNILSTFVFEITDITQNFKIRQLHNFFLLTLSEDSEICELMFIHLGANDRITFGYNPKDLSLISNEKLKNILSNQKVNENNEWINKNEVLNNLVDYYKKIIPVDFRKFIASGFVTKNTDYLIGVYYNKITVNTYEIILTNVGPGINYHYSKDNKINGIYRQIVNYENLLNFITTVYLFKYLFYSDVHTLYKYCYIPFLNPGKKNLGKPNTSGTNLNKFCLIKSFASYAPTYFSIYYFIKYYLVVDSNELMTKKNMIFFEKLDNILSKTILLF